MENAWDTDVRITFLDDGMFVVFGLQGNQIRGLGWRIGEITLEPGIYSFSGLSGVEKNTVRLELEADNHRFTPDVARLMRLSSP